MKGHTHLAGGVALALVSSEITGFCKPDELSIPKFACLSIFIISAASGSLLPDIDHKRSIISCKHKIISFFSRLLFSKRGFTHSLLCMAILGVFLNILTSFIPVLYAKPIVYGFMLGYMSHLILDCFTPMGIPLFFPFKTLFSVGKIKSGGLIDNILFIALFISILCLVNMRLTIV